MSSYLCNTTLGYPGENDEDRQMTWNVVHELTKTGVDEIALFIVAPVPGAAIFETFTGYSDYSQLNFSPAWRRDYTKINKFRKELYLYFLIWKFRYYPLKLLKQLVNLLTRRFKTKMEMTPYRAMKTYLSVHLKMLLICHSKKYSL